MTYTETVNYLYNKLPMFSRTGSAAFKKDLTNIKLLCEHLGNPQTKFKTIHVGGTNGKGSVSHSLAAIFQTTGYKTGLHTSPHLYDFRERIKLNGQMVPEEFVVRFVADIKTLIEKLEPSFFEITVAMAFQFFADEKVNIAIIEVGLGGRLDSTNILLPELSVITNIGLDHTNMLGTTLAEIAGEKAGIIKKKTPVVIGESLLETKPVFETVAEQNDAPIHFADEILRVENVGISTDNLNVLYKTGNGQPVKITTDLSGIYQAKNMRTVLTAVDVLTGLGWKLDDELVRQALVQVKPLTGLQGRWDVIKKEPAVVLEVAHNKEGIEQMLRHITQLSFHHLHIIMGVVKDKDIEPMLALLPPDASYYFTQAHIPRALPAAHLMAKASAAGLRGDDFGDVNTALQSALSKSTSNDLIIICGSIFLVAEVNRPLVP